MNIRAPRNLPFLLKVYFILGGVILVTLALYYNNTLIRRMRAQSDNTTQLFSRFIAIELTKVEEVNRQDFIGDVINTIDIPIVITDPGGRPVLWNIQTGIPQVRDDEYTRTIDFDPANPTDHVMGRALRKAQAFDRVNDPIKIPSGKVHITIHYGASALTNELTVAPYVQVAVFVLFMLFGFLGFRAMKIGEQRSVWVGMAKETAHQLGTPLSSIMGWITMIRDGVKEGGDSQKLTEAVEEAAADVDRLSKISARFSKIGSKPKLEYHELTPIIEDTVDYFERRRPALKIHSTITVDVEELPLVRCSTDLVGWVFENLIKNSLDAIASDGGKINIKGRVSRNEGRVEITFSDNGRGMNQSVKNRIFTPGFTTKERGWGLGLALTKRIIEEIHRGSIKVLHTQPGKGTAFLITFPVDWRPCVKEDTS